MAWRQRQVARHGKGTRNPGGLVSFHLGLTQDHSIALPEAWRYAIQIADRLRLAIRSAPSPACWGRTPARSAARFERNKESRVRRLRALPRHSREGRGPAQNAQTAQGGRGHATVGRRFRRRVATGIGARRKIAQPAEAGLPDKWGYGHGASRRSTGHLHCRPGANSSRS